MKFISYLRDGQPRLAATDGDDAIDLNAADPSIPSDLTAALALCEDLVTAAETIMESSAPRMLLEELTLAPAIPRPGKVLCLGLNYADHAAEAGIEAPPYPSIFMRGASSLAGHGGEVPRPRVSELLDFEAELACVIGRRARYVSRAEALNHVFGYACFNDITLRDYQMKTPTWTVGKNFDRTGALGPWILTRDELPAGAAGLRIQLRLNGVAEQNANTSQMIVGVAHAIELLSEAMTLEPGDVIAMGTPGGIGGARQPPLWMKPGDTVEVEIQGLGVLRNRIVEEKANEQG
jgi:acylpyruvate hydrolase